MILTDEYCIEMSDGMLGIFAGPARQAPVCACAI